MQNHSIMQAIGVAGLHGSDTEVRDDRRQDMLPQQDIILVMELNQGAPNFELKDFNNRQHKLSDFVGQIVLVNFWSCDCRHTARTDRALIAACLQWPGEVALLPIAANRIESDEAIASAARSRGLPPVLMDRQHKVADLYEAVTTPQLFVIDRSGVLRYRGAVDNVTFSQITPTRSFLTEALQALLEDRLPTLTQTSAFGCAIVREALE